MTNPVFNNDEEQPEELLELLEEDVEDLEELVETSATALDSLPAEWLNNLEKSPLPSLVMDSELVIRWRNESFRTFRETEGLSYVGRPFHALFTTFAEQKARSELIDNLQDVKKGYSWQGRVDGRGHRNRLFQASLSVLPFCPFESHPKWYLAVVSDLTDSFKSIVRANFDSILQASLLKDEDTGVHVNRVNAYSKAIARELKGDPRWIEVDEDFIEDIGFLAAFHDVGKIGTPEVILHKNGGLNEEEWEVMKEHPINGALILDAHPNPMAKEIARSHHERWDGTGYPFGQAGDDIPLSGRIVAIADVYDALRTRRPYKEPFSEEKTTSLIVKDSGTHFDPGIIDVFLSIREKFNGIFEEFQDE